MRILLRFLPLVALLLSVSGEAQVIRNGQRYSVPNLSVQDRFNRPVGRVPNARMGLMVGGRVGPTIFFGDLVDSGKAGFAGAVFVEKELNSFLNLRAALEVGFCQGGQIEGDGFRSIHGSLQVGVRFKLLDLIFGYDNQRLCQPYLLLGGGGIFYHPIKKLTGGFKQMWEEAQEGTILKFMDISSFKAAGQVYGGGGCSFCVSRKISITAEIHENMLFSDDYDTHEGYQNGDGSWTHSDGKFDFYLTPSLGVIYRFVSASKFTNGHKLVKSSYSNNHASSSRNANRMRRR